MYKLLRDDDATHMSPHYLVAEGAIKHSIIRGNKNKTWTPTKRVDGTHPDLYMGGWRVKL